jgi:hypothetical protein
MRIEGGKGWEGEKRQGQMKTDRVCHGHVHLHLRLVGGCVKGTVEAQAPDADAGTAEVLREVREGANVVRAQLA